MNTDGGLGVVAAILILVVVILFNFKRVAKTKADSEQPSALMNTFVVVALEEYCSSAPSMPLKFTCRIGAFDGKWYEATMDKAPDYVDLIRLSARHGGHPLSAVRDRPIAVCCEIGHDTLLATAYYRGNTCEAT